MKTLTQGIIVAISFTILTPLALFFLNVFLPYGIAVRVLIAAGTVLYALILALYSERKAGRLVTVTMVALGSGALLALEPRMPSFLMVCAVLIWFSRVSFIAKGLVQVFIECALVAGALIFGVTASIGGASVTLFVWCFFLVLAGGSLVYRWMENKETNKKTSSIRSGSKFEEAFRTAEAALAEMVRG